MKDAQRIFTHYFKLSARGGWNWDWDCASEIEGAIESIIDAAQAPLLKRIGELEAKVTKMDKSLGAIGSHPSLE
jgi:hypothetical protein